MAKLALKNIYKVYDGGVRAVSDFNLDIADKEFVVFVGPSGCGKSTTLRMIAGLEEITAGELYIDDTLMNDIEPKDRNIAMVFQNYALYPHMSVFQNMAFGLKLRKLAPQEIEERVNRAAKILGITDLLTRKPKALSGGQRQRVALGRAIVREPSVFLLDEPLSNLDAKLRVQMRTEITKLHQRLETTFIYVTHDQTEAMTMGDRIVVMKDGFIQQADTPATLFEEPVNIFVATFLGSPQMNIFDIKLEESNTLKGVFGDSIVDFGDRKSKQLVSKSYIGKTVAFGIRPENISIAKDGIKAKVDQVENLGGETIIYALVNGIEGVLTIKIPTNREIKVNDDIYLKFDMEKAHLFDKDTTLSIMGAPRYNEFDCKIDGENLVLNERKILMNEEVRNHLFDFAINQCSKMRVLVDKVSLNDIPDSFEIKCKIDFKVIGADKDILYTTCNEKDGYFIFKVDHCNLNEGDEIVAHIPLKDISFTNDESLKVNSKEIIHDNIAKCHVATSNGKTIIKIKNHKLVFNDLKVDDGDYLFKLLSDKVDFVYNKKYAKKNKIDIKSKPSNTIHVSAYDEEIVGDKNAIFVKIDGFEHYVTIVIDNKFTAYKMPEFDIVINPDSFKLVKC